MLRVTRPSVPEILAATLLVLAGSIHVAAAQTPTLLDNALSIRAVVQVPANTIRVVEDPLSEDLFVLKSNGDLFRVNVTANTRTTIYTTSDHGLGGANVMGLASGPDGTLYVLASVRSDTSSHFRIERGTPGASDSERTWATLARSVEYLSATNQFDHFANGIVVSPDGQYLFANSGSRSDHGEIQNRNDELVDNPREFPITSAIFRIPLNAPETIILQNDADSLLAHGYLFADGVRNSFDLAFDPFGNLLATENSGDRDDGDELNWIREGHHYGFPWRMGANDMPMRFAGYDASTDLLLNDRSFAAANGLYYYDSEYPAPPDNVTFTDPLINFGPDAGFYRDSTSGNIVDAGALGEASYSFTPHRSPLGLVFDTGLSLATPYHGSGFVLSWTDNGSALLGPFGDPSEDLLHLSFIYPVAGPSDPESFMATKVATGFSNPIDAALVENKLYVLDMAFGGTATLWELTFPAASGSGSEKDALRETELRIESAYPNPATNRVSIDYSLAATAAVAISIIDITGRVVHSEQTAIRNQGNHELEINVSGIAAGVYFVKLETDRIAAFSSFSIVR